MTVSDAEYILAPQVGLKLAQSCDKVLVVFDDVLLHQFKEQHVYALADQPFSHTQIINHLMENTGVFKDGRELTSIFIVDTGSNTLHFQKDEDQLLSHVESIADQIIDFTDSMQTKKIAKIAPVLNVKPDKRLPHQDAWQSPFVKMISE